MAGRTIYEAPRGAGRGERVTWDEALDQVARELRRIRGAHGPAADCKSSGRDGIDGEGNDTRGCANVLAADRSAPSGATTYNTCQVEIEALPA